MTKVTNGFDRYDSNEGSFYPSINRDGTRVAFESESSNLDSNGSKTNHRQIFIFDHNIRECSGEITQITNGSGDSFDVSIDDNGSRIVFATFASDLVLVENDINTHSDIILWDEYANEKFFFAGRTESGALPEGGDTKEPVISGDGEIIAFTSSAPNMVSNKGISYIEVIDQGLGYSANDLVNISDIGGNGQGAVARLRLDPYGSIQEIIIDNPGRNYVSPSVSVTRSSTNGRDANVTAHLVNPFGDVFRISVNNIKNNGSANRVSESQKINGLTSSEYGGNERSREPSIARDGSVIAYSTKASNLLDLNITNTSKKVFPNQNFRPATARAILQSGIGKIVIQNPGSGYQNAGSFLIQDLSGNGSGAVVTYEIDSNGAIGSVNIVNPGSGYELENTIVTIPNAGTGTGFQVAQILPPPVTGLNPNRRQGGSSIHRVEMEDIGIGYPSNLFDNIEKPIIVIDGDGLDADGIDGNNDGVLDGDGQADARVNPDVIHFGENGEIYLEQKFDINVTSTTALLSTNLLVQGYDRNVTLNFGNIDNLPSTIGITGRTEEDVRDRLIIMIRSLYSLPVTIFDGPQIENNQTGGNSFTLSGLNLSVTSNNPSALSVRHLSNMLINGSAFTRATPLILPEPVIHGFSEIVTNGVPNITSNGRPTLHSTQETLTDDIYYYDYNSSTNRRISVSNFGFPTNYLDNSNMPSHRFPSMSSDARYVFFSSDAGGAGSIVFNGSNQIFDPDNNRRDIFVRDMKSSALFNDNVQIFIDEEILSVTGYKINLNSEYPILLHGEIPAGSFQSVSLYANGRIISTSQSDRSGSQAFNIYIPWTPDRVGAHVIYAEIIDNVGNVKSSNPVTVNVVETKGQIADIDLQINPLLADIRIWLIVPVINPQTGQITYPVPTGPFTRAEIETMIEQGLIVDRTLAYYEGQGIFRMPLIFLKFILFVHWLHPMDQHWCHMHHLLIEMDRSPLYPM